MSAYIANDTRILLLQPQRRISLPTFHIHQDRCNFPVLYKIKWLRLYIIINTKHPLIGYSNITKMTFSPWPDKTITLIVCFKFCWVIKWVFDLSPQSLCATSLQDSKWSKVNFVGYSSGIENVHVVFCVKVLRFPSEPAEGSIGYFIIYWSTFQTTF